MQVDLNAISSANRQLKFYTLLMKLAPTFLAGLRLFKNKNGSCLGAGCVSGIKKFIEQ
jgi:hypothetical protein